MPEALSDIFNPANPPFQRWTPLELVSVVAAAVQTCSEPPPMPVLAASLMRQAMLIHAQLGPAQLLDYRIAMWMLTGEDAYVAEILRVAQDALADAPVCEAARWALDSLEQQSKPWRDALARIRAAPERN